MPPDSRSRTLIQAQDSFPAGLLVTLWCGFLVYGSLMPFQFQSIPWEKAAIVLWDRLLHEHELRSITDWVTNIAIFAPLGFLGLGAAGWTGSRARAWQIPVVLALCVAVSLGIESMQLFFPPRDTSVLDVIANALGAALGIACWVGAGAKVVNAHAALLRLHAEPNLARLARSARIILLAGCGLLIAAWGGLLTLQWSSGQTALRRLATVTVLPLVEHQAAAITLALVSTLIAALVYAPAGVAFWLLDANGSGARKKGVVKTIGIVAALAALVECAKLFLVSTRPDTGNIVVAGLAAGLGYFVAPLAVSPWPRHQPGTTSGVVRMAKRLGALLCGAGAAALVITYPAGPALLAVGLAVYGAILSRYPTIWLLVIPALLPVLDLAPWTGRFFFDEFDAFVLVTLALGLWRTSSRPVTLEPGKLFVCLVAGLFATFVVSAVFGLLPLQPWDANALSSPYSHFASLRLVKGAVLSLGLAILLGAHGSEGRNWKRALAAGMSLGLATAVGSVLWERVAYAGLMDFAKEFRVVGLFSTMHTGGSHLDAFLIFTLPFAAYWALSSHRLFSRFLAVALFMAGSYSVMMTFSRAAVAALIVVVLVLALWTLFFQRSRTKDGVSPLVKAASGAAIAMLVIAPVMIGSFMQARIATTSTDMSIRNNHWRDALSMMSSALRPTLFGMGLGRYPETYQLLSRDSNKPSIYRFVTDSNNTFLQIQHGASLYVEQIVDVQPHADYKVSMRARSQGQPAAAVNAVLCERTFLQGFNCKSATFQLGGQVGEWRHYEATINSGQVGANPLRVAKLSLENASTAGSVDIDDVALTDVHGADRIRNGSFQAGADRWFFSSPFNHLPWHIKNLWLEILFEQGWVGLLLFSGLVVAVIARLAPRAAGADAFAAALLAATLGFLVVGAFDSLFDAPRLILLFGLGIAAAAIGKLPAHTQARSPIPIAVVPPSIRRQTGPDSARPRPPEGDLRRPASQLVLLVLLVLLVMGMALCIAVATRMPFLPYRVRGLPNAYHPLIAPVLLSAFFFWLFGMPALAARWLSTTHTRRFLYPLLVLGHGLIAWALLQFAVLPDSIHAVVGSPVLAWPWRTEDVVRIVPLLSIFMVQLTGAALVSMAVVENRGVAAVIGWLLFAALLLPMQYWVVVTQAATDNLTELMANNASFGSFVLLNAYVFLVGITGSLLTSLRHGARLARMAVTLVCLVCSLPLGYWLVTLGTEAFIVKDSIPYSALQSVLSQDRSRYANGTEIGVRFAVAHLVAVLMTAFAQLPLWTGFQGFTRRQPAKST